MRSLRVLCLLLTLAVPAAATAAKVCLTDAANEWFYEFGKLKIPKKPDVATPVVGLVFSPVSVTALPLSGTLMRDGNTGTLYLGLTRYFQQCILTAVLDDALSGTVTYDCNLDGTNDGSSEISKSTCAD
jgi:hypothetical protein